MKPWPFVGLGVAVLALGFAATRLWSDGADSGGAGNQESLASALQPGMRVSYFISGRPRTGSVLVVLDEQRVLVSQDSDAGGASPTTQRLVTAAALTILNPSPPPTTTAVTTAPTTTAAPPTTSTHAGTTTAPPPPPPPVTTATVPPTQPPPPTTSTAPPPPLPGPAANWLGSFNASYQAANIGSTITVPAGTYGNQVIAARQDTRNGTCSLTDTSRCIRFVMGGPVKINGSLEIHGAGVLVDGGFNLNITGYADTEATGNDTSNYPDHVVFKRGHSAAFGVFSSTDVSFQDWEAGPNTITKNCVSPGGIENKVSWGGGVEVQPRNVLFDRVYVHDQNGDALREEGPGGEACHYGGLFIVSVNGMTIRNSTFERNVVYHIQIQNFAGPAPTNLLIENSSFGCAVDWLYRTPLHCDGQRAVQLSTASKGINLRMVNNASANGPDGLFGLYWPNADASLVSETGTQVFPQSMIAPPLPR